MVMAVLLLCIKRKHIITDCEQVYMELLSAVASLDPACLLYAYYE